jgi:UDP-glucose 4-epimerase
MRALVTGGAGFIGSHIAVRLLAEGAQVRILDNLSSGRQENLDACPQAEFLPGDITSPEDARRAVSGCDVVFHHAALVSVQESIRSPERSFAVNSGGTACMLWAAHRAGVKRFVLASSAAVYGDDPRLPKSEVMVPTPISPYGADKAAAECHVTMAHRLWGMDTVVLRYFNVFGPRQDPQGDYAAVIPRFVSRLVSGTPPTVYGDGSQTRDFLYIDDLVSANLAAATSPASPGGTFNIARGETVNLLDLLRTLEEATGCRVPPVFEPAREGDIVHSAADVSLARRVLGFSPRTDLRSGLALTAQYFRAQK